MTGVNVIFSITDLASSALGNIRGQMNAVANDITQASTALFFWSEAFNKIKAASSQFYELFIGQNETMRQQILATQSSLSAVQDVYLQGIKLTNPKDAIQAFEAPIKKSLNQIAIASLDLVGVTSAQLTNLFQISLTNATKITNQSKQFADPIKAAETLTISLAGAFGAMGIPLFQARQEINSILTGTIDMNSRLAKSLNITNDQVRLWGSQGRLVDELNKRLEPFVAGNALAARSVSGISSNLEELLQITTRLAGESITSLFVDGLDSIYQYLKQIQPEIQQTFNQITNFIVGVVQGAGTILAPFVSSFATIRDAVLSIGRSIGAIVGGSIQVLLAALTTVTPILTPIFALVAEITKLAAGLLGDPVIQKMIQIALIITTIIGPLATIATTIATIVTFFQTGGSLVTFFILLSQVAPGLVASLSAIGAALASITGFGGSAAAIVASGSAMTVLGGAITTVAMALLPLAAAIAAVTVAAMLFKEAETGDTREAVETVSARADETSGKAIQTTQGLRELQDKEFLDGGLSDENKAKKKSLITQGTIQSSELESQIADLKAIDTKGNESLENAKQASIAQNELMLKSLGKFVGGLSTSAKPILEVGGAITQLNSNVAAFEKQIKEANSDAEFQAASKGISGLIQKQVELGQITANEGKKLLQRTLGDARVDLAGKEAAQKAIEKVQDIEMKRQLDAVQQNQAAINLLKDQGLIGEAKAEQELTAEKIKEVDIRSASQKIAHAERMRQIQVEMNAELGKIDKEIESQQKVVDKLKVGNAPKVQVVAAERELARVTTSRETKQADFVDVQKEENRATELEVAKSAAERAKLEKQQRDKANQERLKDFDERQKINDSARDQGLKDNQQAAVESIKIAEGRTEAELSQIKNKTAKLEVEAKKQGKTVQQYDKEAWEALQVQQAEALQKLASARKDGFEKRLSDIKQDAQEALAVVEASQAKNDIDNQEAAVKTAAISTKSINNQLALIDKEIAASKGNVERLEELNAKKAGLEKELTEVQKKELQSRLSDLQQDAEERVAVVKAANATGAIDNQQAAQQTAAIESTSANSQLKLIQTRIAEVQKADKARGKVSVELLEELRKQEADTQVKITEIAKKEMDARLADLREDAQERVAVVKAANATGAIDNQAAAVQTGAIERSGAAQRLEIVRKRIEQVADEAKKSGKLNVELMEDLKKQEADIQVEITEIDKKEMESRLADLQQDADERTAVIQAANALGTKDNQEAAIATSQVQQKSANDQLKIVQDRIKAVMEEAKKSGKPNIELLEELRKKEADIQVKITEIQKQELQKRLADLREDAEERTAVVAASNATGLIDNQKAAVETARIQRGSLDSQLALIRERISTTNPKNKELLEDLRKQEADVQVKITEVQKQELQKRLADLQEDEGERIAVTEAANAQGLIDNQQAATATIKAQEDSSNKQISLIQQRISEVTKAGAKTGKVNKELLEELQKQEAEVQKKIIEARKQFLQRQLSDLQQDAEERLAVVTSLNARGLIDNQESAIKSSNIQRQSLDTQLRLVQERLKTIGSTNQELNEELQKQEADIQVKITEIQEQSFQKRLSDLQQDAEERLAIVTSENTRGLTDNQQTAIQAAAIQEESAQQQLRLIQDRLVQTSKSSIELREKLLKLEADTQAKIAEIRKQSFEKRLADIEQDGQEQQTILEGQLAQGLTTEVEYAQNRYNQSLQSLDTQLALVRERRSQISATDIEGQEALAAQEAGLQKKRQDALSQFLEAQLSLIDRENKAATEVLEQSELDRKLIVKQASLTGLANKDASADAEIKATQRRIIQEIALEEQKNATLRSLSAFSDPAKEADRQSRIRASVKKTTELRLQLLDEERKAFDTLIDRQIKGIQNQARERELASDVEVRAIEFQSKQYDLLSRSLENQNKLLQSRSTLANALNGFIQGEYRILQDTAESEGEKKRLIKEAADAQLVALKQQQVVAQKNLEIEIKQAEIAQKRAEFEAQIAENKAKVGAMKAESDVLKAESTLQKVQRDPNASNADVAAAKLDVVAAKAAADAAIEGIALAIANKELTIQQGDNLSEINQNKRDTLGVEQSTQSRAAQSQAISSIVDPGERALAAKELAGRLTPLEVEKLARVRRLNYEAEQRRIASQNERDALAGIVRPRPRQIAAAQARAREIAGKIESPSETIKAVEAKVPSLSGIVAKMREQQKNATAIKPDTNPLLKLQSDSNGYQREMVSLLKQIQQRPSPEPGKQVSNNFNIKAEAGINEAQVLGIFGGVTQEISRMVR